MDLISDRIRKNMPVGFRLGSGAARIQAWPASLKLGGVPSWPGQLDCPVHGLSTGSVLWASCQKQGDISDCIPKNVPADSCKLVIYFLGKKKGGGGDF